MDDKAANRRAREDSMQVGDTGSTYWLSFNTLRLTRTLAELSLLGGKEIRKGRPPFRTFNQSSHFLCLRR
jgi:hypothetical protein